MRCRSAPRLTSLTLYTARQPPKDLTLCCANQRRRCEVKKTYKPPLSFPKFQMSRRVMHISSRFRTGKTATQSTRSASAALQSFADERQTVTPRASAGEIVSYVIFSFRCYTSRRPSRPAAASAQDRLWPKQIAAKSCCMLRSSLCCPGKRQSSGRSRTSTISAD